MSTAPEGWDTGEVLDVAPPAAAAPEGWDAAAPVEPAPPEPRPEDVLFHQIHNRSAGLDLERRSQVFGLAEKLKLAPEFVDRNFDYLKKQDQAQSFDPAKWRRENPRLAGAVLDNPALGEIIVRDEALAGFWGFIRKARQFALETDAGPGVNLDRLALPPGAEDSFAQALSQARVTESPEAMGRVEAAGAPQQQTLRVDARSREVQEGGVLDILGASFTDARQRREIAHLKADRGRAEVQGDTATVSALTEQIQFLESISQPRDYAGDSALGQLAESVGQQGSIMADASAGSMAGSLATLGLGALVGLRNPAAGARVAALGPSIAAAGGALAISKEILGDTYDEIRNTPLDDGTLPDPAVAMGAAVVSTYGQSLVESLSFGATGRAAGNLGRVATGQVLDAAKDLTLRKKLARIGTEYLKSAATESVIEEPLQSLIDDATQYVGRSAAAGTLQKADPVGALVDAAQAGIAALPVALVTSGATSVGGSAVSAVVDRAVDARRERQEAKAATVAAEILNVSESATAKAAPKVVAELIARETENDGPAATHVYVTPEVALQLFQGDPPPDVKLRLEEAALVGGKVEVPTAEFIKDWASREGAASLSEHITTMPGGMTTAEMRQFGEQVKAEADAIQVEEEVPAEEVPLVQALEAQLTATGLATNKQAKLQAALIRARLRVLAEREGVPLADLVGDYVLRVERGTGQVEGAPAVAAQTARVEQGPVESLDTIVTQARAEGVALDVFEKGDVLTVPRIVVPEEQRGGGVGTRYMERLVRYADETGKTLALTPSTDFGATSKARLARFYARFGFMPNKGRGRDLTINEEMVRRPRVTRLEQAPVDNPAFREWFGDSKVVDGEGRPLVLYHGTKQPTFDTFNIPSWFTTEPREASAYAGHREAGFLPAKNTPGGAVVPVYLSIQNPMEVGWNDIMSGAQGTIERAKAAGHDGLKALLPENKVLGYRQRQFYIPFAPEQIKSATGNRGTFDPNSPSILYQRDDTAPRGFMERAQKRFRVVLNPNADLSTFLHETGHVFLELMGDMAARDGASQQTKDDWQALLKWLGSDGKITVEQHEKFARGFERYLMEGKSPSLALTRHFQAFRIWLTRIYRTVRGLNVELSDEVRGVFDRMLATDEEIQAARQRAGIPAKPPADAPQDVIDAWTKAREAEENAGLRAALEQAQRETEQWWQDELEAETKAAGEEYDKLRETRAWRHLREAEPAIQLRRAEVEKAVGKETAKAKFAGLLTSKKDGARISDVADELGFKSGPKMLAALVQHPDRDTWSKARAEQAMKDKHGDITEEREKLAKAIEAAQHSDAGYLNVIIKETLSLRQKTGSRGPAIEALKLKARQVVQASRSSQIDPRRALKKERAAAERAIQLKDPKKKLEALEQRLFAHFLYREHVEAEKQIERQERLVERLSNADRRGRVGLGSPQLRDVTDAVVAKLGGRVPDAPDFNGIGIAGVAETLTGAGVDPVFDVERVGQALAAPDTDLRVGDLGEVVKLLQQLRLAGSVVSEMAVGDKRKAIMAIAATVLQEAKQFRDLGLLPKDTAYKAEERRKKLERMGLINAATDPEEMFRRMGPEAHALFRDFLDRQAQEETLAGEVLAEIVRLWEKMPKAMQDSRFDEVDSSSLPLNNRTLRDETTTTRQWMWMVFLNVGNEGNLQRLLDGYGWKREQVFTFLEANMTPEEARFLQGVGDLMEKLRPSMERTYEEVFGVKPGRVVRRPFTMQFADGTSETFEGFYFPAKYDPFSRDPSGILAAKQADAGIQDVRQSSKATLANGFTQGRAARFAGTINLEWSAVPAHMSQVIHYVAFENFVRKMNRLFANDSFREAVIRTYGQRGETTLKNWLKTVATARDESITGDSLALLQFAGKYKSRTVASALTYSFSVFGPDFLNLVNPVLAKQVSVRNFQKGLRLFFRNPRQMRQAALAASPELRKRSSHLRDTLLAKLSEIGPRGSEKKSGARAAYERFEDVVKENGYFLSEKMDAIVSTAIWYAALEDAKERLVAEAKQIQISESDTGRLKQNALAADIVPDLDSKARQVADDVVRTNQPAASMLEQPAILRDRRGVGLILAMFGFWSRMGNVGLRMWRDAPTRRAKAEAFCRWWAMMIVINTFGSLVSGGGPEEDEEWSEWAIRKSLSAPFLVVPFVSSIAEAASSAGVGYAYHDELKWRRFSFMTSPALAALERLVNAIANAVRAEEPIEQVGAVLEAVGITRGLPVSAVRRPVRYFYNWEETGPDEPLSPSGVLDITGGVLLGENPDYRRENVFTVGAEAAEGMGL